MLATNWNTVLYAVNAIGRDARHYTVMMVRNGTVLARRHGLKENRRLVIRGHVAPEFRDEETLRYIAWLKGFVVL